MREVLHSWVVYVAVGVLGFVVVTYAYGDPFSLSATVDARRTRPWPLNTPLFYTVCCALLVVWGIRGSQR